MSGRQRGRQGGRGRVVREAEADVVDVFESNPFRAASVVTIQGHLVVRGVDLSEPEVRDCCERLVERDVLAFDGEVGGRPTYAYHPD